MFQVSIKCKVGYCDIPFSSQSVPVATEAVPLCAAVKRQTWSIAFCLLLFTTAIAGAMTAFTHDQYQAALAVQRQHTVNTYADDPPAARPGGHTDETMLQMSCLYWTSVTVLVLSATLLGLIAAVWSVVELCVCRACRIL